MKCYILMSRIKENICYYQSVFEDTKTFYINIWNTSIHWKYTLKYMYTLRCKVQCNPCMIALCSKVGSFIISNDAFSTSVSLLIKKITTYLQSVSVIYLINDTDNIMVFSIDNDDCSELLITCSKKCLQKQ